MRPNLSHFLPLIAIWILAVAAIRLESMAAAEEADDSARLVQQKESVRRGHTFLIGLFDPELNLLPEFRGSKTYWLFHDNYLAARVLAEAKPELSNRIQTALAKFGVLSS